MAYPDLTMLRNAVAKAAIDLDLETLPIHPDLLDPIDLGWFIKVREVVVILRNLGK